MIGFGVGLSSGSIQRPFGLDAAGERLSAPERTEQQAAALSRPIDAPQDGVGGNFQNAVAATSRTGALSSDTRSGQASGVQAAGVQSAGQTNNPAAGGTQSLASSGSAGGSAAQPQELTPEEQAEVDRLAARDREVRAHEQAHARVGGAFASQPTYEFVTGPDGQQYAVAGEVQIDAAPIPGDPEGTIRKLDIVIRAALAPAEPSSQDLAVARQARADQAAARQELRDQRQAELSETSASIQAGPDGEENEEGEDSETGELEALQEQTFQAIAAYNATQNSLSQIFGGGTSI